MTSKPWQRLLLTMIPGKVLYKLHEHKEHLSPRGHTGTQMVTLLLGLHSHLEAHLPAARDELLIVARILTIPWGRALSLPGPYMQA